MQSDRLVKAKLIAVDQGVEDIEFMFNPTRLKFIQEIELTRSEGSRTEEGLPKVSFAYPKPRPFTIENILCDTYEDGISVLTHLKKFQKAVDFAEAGEGQGKRPPIYVFTWGEQQYMRCFVTSLGYDLTMFLPDGTPVRAELKLSLEKADDPISQPSMGTPAVVNRDGDNRQSRGD